MDKKAIEKEAIIAEYLTGENSYRKLGNKYGIDFRLIHSWVMKYEGKNENHNYSLKIFNSIGQVVFNETLTDFQGEYSRPMKFKTLGKGGYMLKFSGTTGKLIKRIIIY